MARVVAEMTFNFKHAAPIYALKARARLDVARNGLVSATLPYRFATYFLVLSRAYGVY
jgi:hypothetical protein